MNLITRLRNILFLRKILKGNINLGDINYRYLLDYGFSTYRNFKKGGFERNLMSAVIKKLRKDSPYQLQGWAESEKAYKKYMNKDNSIKCFQRLKEGDYLTRISNESPVKGEKPFEYYVNMSWSAGEKIPYTIKLADKNKKYGYFNIEDCNFGIGVDKDNFTSYLYATEEEIFEYKEKKRRKEELENKIQEKREEINRLTEQIRKL